LKIEPINEKSKSTATGQAEILPSGMTEKKSIPEPHRRRDFLPDSNEFITPMNGTMPATRGARLPLSPNKSDGRSGCSR